jgi:hypothetical protein
MAVSTVWRLVYFLAPSLSEPMEQTAAHRRGLRLGETRCAPLLKSNQAALGITLGEGLLMPLQKDSHPA